MFMAPLKVHQIWFGGNMPAEETQWTQGIRAGAERAGLEYNLWTETEIQREFGDEPAWGFFRNLLDVEPGPKVLTLMSDYYRFRVLATHGGVYLDTDFMLSGDFPELPQCAGILAATEFWAPNKPCTGFLAVDAPANFSAVMSAADAQLHICRCGLSTLGAADWWRANGGRNILNLWGPKWYRQRGLRAAMRAGVPVHMVHPRLVGHVQWKTPSGLTHVGTAHWH